MWMFEGPGRVAPTFTEDKHLLSLKTYVEECGNATYADTLLQAMYMLLGRAENVESSCCVYTSKANLLSFHPKILPSWWNMTIEVGVQYRAGLRSCPYPLSTLKTPLMPPPSAVRASLRACGVVKRTTTSELDCHSVLYCPSHCFRNHSTSTSCIHMQQNHMTLMHPIRTDTDKHAKPKGARAKEACSWRGRASKHRLEALARTDDAQVAGKQHTLY